jgi:ABC-type multidrug transport system ATPase subunit
MSPTSGTFTWGPAARTAHGQLTVGYLPQEFGLYARFSARTFLRFLGTLRGVDAVAGARLADSSLELVGLAGEGDRPLEQLSGGMRQRVGLAQALLTGPPVLILDEPAVGLDPEERLRLRVLLSTLAADRLVLVSTHVITDVEDTASQLLLLRGGRIVADTTPAALIRSADGAVWKVAADKTGALDLQARYNVSHLAASGSNLALRIVSASRPAAGAVQVEATLEEAYLHALADPTKQAS